MTAALPLKAIIIDDERLARLELRNMLAQYRELAVIGEADSVDHAAALITEQSPDVIFLDIQMPGKTGFDLLPLIAPDIRVIFVTAYDEYALRAFEVNALDYLMKPVHPDRLAKAIQRLVQTPDISSENTRPLRYDDRLFIHLDTRMEFLKISSITAITAAGDYTELHRLNRGKSLSLKSMKEWEARLPENYFCRIHRSAMVNLEYIEKLEEWFNYSYRVYMKGIDDPFVISRRYVHHLKDKMG